MDRDCYLVAFGGQKMCNCAVIVCSCVRRLMFRIISQLVFFVGINGSPENFCTINSNVPAVSLQWLFCLSPFIIGSLAVVSLFDAVNTAVHSRATKKEIEREKKPSRPTLIFSDRSCMLLSDPCTLRYMTVRSKFLFFYCLFSFPRYSRCTLFAR